MTNKEVGERIKLARERRGLNKKQLAQKIRVADSTIMRYESGTIVKIKMPIIESIANALNVNPMWLIGKTEDSTIEKGDSLDYSKYGLLPIETKRFPLLGEIACGKPIFAVEDRESYVEAGTNVKADFCLKAKGDSMINARIYDGDIVFIHKQNMVENGEIAAVIIDDDATLKRVYYERNQNRLSLNAENPKYGPLIYVGEELNHIVILGKAVAFQSDIK